MNDSIRPNTLKFDRRDGYLYILVNAELLHRDSALGYLAEISDKCIEFRYRRLMIEIEAIKSLSNADLFYICEQFAGMMHGFRVTFLTHQTTETDGLSFALLVLNNRGVQAEAHPSIKSGEQWLLR